MRLGPFEVWEDVMDESLDAYVAPEFGPVVRKDPSVPKIYTDSREFFRRTYFTDSMLDILEKLVETLEGRSRHNVFLIYSLFGGGKTHTILTVYHAFNDPEAMLDEEVLNSHDPEKRRKIEELANRIKALGEVKVIPVYGKDELGSPANPLNVGPYEIKTLWGYIAHLLGRYAEVERYDRTADVPPGNVLTQLFGERKVVLLLDEIVHYINSLHNSADETNRRYAKNVMSFLDSLTTSILGTKSSMVITLPMAKEEGGTIKTEEQYDREVVVGTWRAVTRVGGAELYSPLRTGGATNELVEVIKKRIFRTIDPVERSKVLTKMRQALSDSDVFGRDPYFDEALSKNYPFHPEYVEILRTIIEKTGLQRTRDLLRITRIVVRKLVHQYRASGFAPALIMPHHIDPRDEKIRGIFFGRDSKYADYATIVDTDLNPAKFRDFKIPELAQIELTYVFLKTYPFDSSVALDGFPTAESIARGVYEPNLFEYRGWQPVDIRDIFEEINMSVRFVYLNKKEGTLWFWRVANVSQMVNSKTEEILKTRGGEVLVKLTDYVANMVREGKVPGKKGKGAKIEGSEIRFFPKKNIVVSKEPEELPDTPEYKLHVLVRDDVDKETLEKIIYRIGVGTRTFKNTIVVCYPLGDAFEGLLKTTARIMACDEVSREISKKYGNYGEEVVSLQMHMVKEIKDNALETLVDGVVSAFRQVAYPQDDDVEVVTAQASSKSVVENVYVALAGREKIIEEINFEGFVDMLEEYGGVRILREEGYRVSELLNLLRMNTRLPFMENRVVTEAIKEGIEKLKVGIERSGKIIFKRVYEGKPPEEDEKGNAPKEIELHDILFPPEVALERQVNELLRDEREYIIERGGKNYWVKIWYEVFLSRSDERGIPLREFVEETESGYRIKPDEFENLLYGYIVRMKDEIVITEGEFDVELSETVIVAEPDEAVEIEVIVKPLGKDSFDVELSVDMGELDSTTVHLEDGNPVEVTWTIIIPQSKRTATLTAKSHKRTVYRDIELKPKLKPDIVETPELKEEHVGMELLAILGIKDREVLNEIDGERIKARASGSFEFENAHWRTEFSRVDLEVLKYLLKETEEMLESKAEVNIELSVEEKLVVDRVLFEALRKLNNKVVFRLRRVGE